MPIKQIKKILDVLGGCTWDIVLILNGIKPNQQT
jgi:hypothetical protein